MKKIFCSAACAAAMVTALVVSPVVAGDTSDMFKNFGVNMTQTFGSAAFGVGDVTTGGTGSFTGAWDSVSTGNLDAIINTCDGGPCQEEGGAPVAFQGTANMSDLATLSFTGESDGSNDPFEFSGQLAVQQNYYNETTFFEPCDVDCTGN